MGIHLIARSKSIEAMKFSLFLLTAFLFVVQNEVMGKPAPNPSPDNDVHFHVNMPGSGKSFPLKGQAFRDFLKASNRDGRQKTFSRDRGSEGQKALDSGKLENGKDYRYPLAMEK